MFKKLYIGRWQMMLGLEKKLIEKELPPGMYHGKVPIGCEVDYNLLTEILPSNALIALYENIGRIKVPDKYKKNL